MYTQQLYFYSSTDVTYVFKQFTLKDNTGGYVLALIVTFLIAFIVEFLNYIRFVLQSETHAKIVYNLQ